jgi:2-methylcitrate dehydratase PrpD
MIVEGWAERFGRRAPLGAEEWRAVDLHLADAATAFFAGARSSEGRAIAGFLAGRKGGSIDAAVGAISALVRRTECDDIHVASCITPAAVVMPCALAATMRSGGGPERFGRAVAAGYEVGLRLGLALGGAGAFAAGIWPSYFAAPMMAAATVGVALGFESRGIADAIALAAAGASGRIGRPTGTPSARWLSFGEAVAKGCRAALAVESGFHGDVSLVSEAWISAIAQGAPVNPQALSGDDRIHGVGEVGLKPFVAARQILNALIAFQEILADGVQPSSIERIEIGLPSLNVAMAERTARHGDRLSTIANIHFQIAATALRPGLLYDTERENQSDADLVTFATRVVVAADPSLDAYLPDVWAGRVRVTARGRTHTRLCERIPGDPGDAMPERVIRAKLDAMVALPDRRICSALLDVNAEARGPNVAALWQRMVEVIEG